MVDLGISPFMDLASKVQGIKKTEVLLPIAKKSGNVTPLLVGDDLSLRSSLTSPVGYDREMIQLLHRHTEFIDANSTIPSNIQLPYPTFCKEISSIDKLSLLWGLYKSTYDTLGSDREFTCPKADCHYKFKEVVYLDDLIHEDTYALWDKVDNDGKEIPFYNYRFEIAVEYDKFLYEFSTRLPSIQNNNAVLGRISIEILQRNLETIGSIFTRNQQMTLLTRAIRLSSKDGSFQPAMTENIDEMLITFQNHIPMTVSEKFFDEYGKEFDKYVPQYYKNLKCPQCGNKFKHSFDLEIEFFRRSLLNRA